MPSLGTAALAPCCHTCRYSARIRGLHDLILADLDLVGGLYLLLHRSLSASAGCAGWHPAPAPARVGEARPHLQPCAARRGKLAVLACCPHDGSLLHARSCTAALWHQARPDTLLRLPGLCCAGAAVPGRQRHGLTERLHHLRAGHGAAQRQQPSSREQRALNVAPALRRQGWWPAHSTARKGFGASGLSTPLT